MSVVIKKKAGPNRLYLGGLGLAVALLIWSNIGSDPPAAPKNTAPTNSPAAAADAPGPVRPQRRGSTARGTDFHPILGSKRPEDRIDLAKVDPALRLDLLAKVQSVPLEGGARNLFQFGAAAPPPGPTTPIPKVPKVIVTQQGPLPVTPVNTQPPPAPTAPPIPLKYYGFANAKNEQRRKAFFLDGEDIIVAWEGDTVKSRYRIVHIGVNSVEMEDMQFKSKQTLPLEAELAG